MKNWLIKTILRLHLFSTKTDRMAHIWIFLTFAANILAKVYRDGTPYHNMFDALEVIFFLAASITYARYIIGKRD